MNKRDRAVEENLGLVHACCKRFAGRGIEYDDMFSTGCIGLIKAIDRFDEQRGLRFSTYAVPVILGELKQLFRDGGTVKVSRSYKELAMKAAKMSRAYEQEHGEEPTVSELARLLGESPQKLAQALNAVRLPLSLTPSQDGDDAQIDVPVDFAEEAIAERLSLNQAIEALHEQDKRLIVLRYYKQKTQSQTARELGMTQVQVSRREKKLLTFMREKLSV